MWETELDLTVCMLRPFETPLQYLRSLFHNIRASEYLESDASRSSAWRQVHITVPASSTINSA